MVSPVQEARKEAPSSSSDDWTLDDLRSSVASIADDLKMTKKDLQHWVDKATCHALCGSTVSWVAAESLHGWGLALEWIESKKENVAVTGWATLSSLVGIKDDAELDLAALKRLLLRAHKTLHREPNRVRHAMNGFYVQGLFAIPSLRILHLSGFWMVIGTRRHDLRELVRLQRGQSAIN